MAASVYLRTRSSNNHVAVSLLCSKSKVALLKRLTIQRLELAAAVMLTKLVHHCLNVLNLQKIPCYLWTESSIVSSWLNSHPSKWKEYAHNRVCLIQEILPQAPWKHISGKTNPADCATRGLTVVELQMHPNWWTGPSWLAEESSNWPTLIPRYDGVASELEKRPQPTPKILHISDQATSWDLLNRCSTLKQLLRITAICQRITQILLKKSPKPLTTLLTPDELDKARKYWISRTQHEHFGCDVQSLINKGELPKANSLLRLLPFVDGQGLLRVGGRLKNSSLDYSTKHPYILPKSSTFTNLIIRDAHHETLHGSTRDTLNLIRHNNWIVGGRIPIRSFILKCVTCTRHRRAQAQQLMGQLPASRVNPSRPFLHSGVDYAGPFSLKTWKGRTTRTYKSWIALFVCHDTSAIHLELVTDYSTEAFLAAYKRFTARRGICATLNSDCGTNFKGADKELEKLFSQNSSELRDFASLIANDGTRWVFNPPAAPHFGGKFEAAVKSMKYHLRRVVGETILTYEELSRVLPQIEAILNSRPLCALTKDPEDLNVLTPGHFLIGQPILLVPEPNLELLRTTRLSRWQRLSQMTQSFWKTWSKEYLKRFQAVYKRNQTSSPIQEGDLVLIMDDRYLPAKWPLGRVIKLLPGSDNVVRVVTIKTSTSTITRPIVKLCPLPVTMASEVHSSPGATKAGGIC